MKEDNQITVLTIPSGNYSADLLLETVKVLLNTYTKVSNVYNVESNMVNFIDGKILFTITTNNSTNVWI